MRFSSLFGSSKPPQVPTAPATPTPEVPIAPDSSTQNLPAPGPIGTCRDLSGVIGTEKQFSERTWFLPTQSEWIYDQSPLKIMEKSRQVGATRTDTLDSVLKVSPADAKFDVFVTSRDELQAGLYVEDAIDWARIFNLAAIDLGVVLLDSRSKFSARVLQFANGRRIYSLSSNPNALAGKRGHVKIDEFALHEDQRLLYRIAKPVTQWGGTLSIISTHRGPGTLFNQIIRGIRHNGNPMGWHLFSYPIQKAVKEGIVERINEKSGRNESREEFLRRLRAECIDEEQWLQEYCCIPADESAAFITHEMITTCEEPGLKLMTLSELVQYCRDHPDCTLYLGVDVARKRNLCVLDVGEKIGDVTLDRLRIELHNRRFSEIEDDLYTILQLPQVKRCCIDAGGVGIQLHERAQEQFGWKVEGITFTAPLKEEMAFALRHDFEDRQIRIVLDEDLRADLRALRKQVTTSGNIRFDGEVDNSHCDRTWAKALRQHAARNIPDIGAMVG